jgi:hypothetical protein
LRSESPDTVIFGGSSSLALRCNVGGLVASRCHTASGALSAARDARGRRAAGERCARAGRC